MSPFTLNWGIISTGGIAKQFSQDLLVDPSTRDVSDVQHKIAAVGSRSVESAQTFLDKLRDADASAPHAWGGKQGLLKETKAYGSYDEVYNDPNVNAVYVATPHTYHHRNAKDALLAGKHVLCEKPFTLDLSELEELIAIATEKGLFLMEAVWTRFFPIAYKIQEIIHSGQLGKVKRMSADFSNDFGLDSLPDSSRMIDPALCGGSLLDQGPYPSVWAMLIMHHHPDNKGRAAPKVLFTTQTIYKRSGVDANSRWRLEWDGVGQADLTTDMTTHSLKDNTMAVQCEQGDLLLEGSPCRPTAYSIVPHNPELGHKIVETTRHEDLGKPGAGMHYEADEVARCIRDGKKESERMPLEESRIVQGILDQVRKNGDSALKNMKGSAGQ